MKLDCVIAERTAKTIYRDGDTCIKMFADGYSKADILNEALNQARVEETGLTIPRISAVTTVDGKWAILSDYIAGKTLAQLMEEDPDHRDAWLERFVELQLVMHTKTNPDLNRLTDKLKRRICEAEIDAVTRYDLLTRLEGMPVHHKLCHGDFNPSNVILTDDGTAYILDWAHAAQGNASADAARTYLLFRLEGDQESAEKYLELFCEKSRTEKRYVQNWMPLVAAAESVKGDEKEREFLLSWIGVVDYE